MFFQLLIYKECWNLAIKITLRVYAMALVPSLNFVKYKRTQSSVLHVNILCCISDTLKGLITFQFIAWQGGDKGGNFLKVILLLCLRKLCSVCGGRPRTDMIASLKQSFLAITLNQKIFN